MQTEKTYFASAERARWDELRNDIESVSKNSVVDELMRVVSGLLAVLNEHRQILSLNKSFLKMLGADDAGDILGLRPGESVRCVHAHELEGGCGTSEYCPTCGAAIAIVASLGENRPVERTCAITVEKDGHTEDLFFRVRCCPITFRGKRFLLLFLQDISMQQQWAVMEKVFFHDINNILDGLLGSAQLMPFKNGTEKDRLARKIYQLSLRLNKEIAIQRSLSQSQTSEYQPLYHQVSLREVLQELGTIFSDHAIAKDRKLVFPEAIPDCVLTTDSLLLTRILVNMVTNALEASEKGDRVRIFAEPDQNGIFFGVWNRQAIPEDIAKRIFQRNFSTKQGMGRGTGTFSMKYFGERILGGEVNFTTSVSEGTCFRFHLKV